MGRIGQRIEFEVVEAHHTREDRFAYLKPCPESASEMGDEDNVTPDRIALAVRDLQALPTPGTKVVLIGGFGLDGCLAKVGVDEPLFALIARDADAPETIRFWAACRLGELDLYPELFHPEPEWTARLAKLIEESPERAKIAEALGLADEMERWRKVHRP